MNEDQALPVVRMLADGVDPITEQEFATDSPYQHPRIIRAMLIAQRVLEDHAKRQRRQQALPENAGKPWSEDEDGKLIEGFDAKRSIRELATQHQRSLLAIEARLVRLGKLPPEAGLRPGKSG